MRYRSLTLPPPISFLLDHLSTSPLPPCPYTPRPWSVSILDVTWEVSICTHTYTPPPHTLLPGPDIGTIEWLTCVYSGCDVGCVNLYTHTPIHPSRLTPPPLPAYTPVIIEWLTCVYSGCDVGCVNLYTHTPIHPSRLTPPPLPAYTPVIIEWLTCVYSGCDVGCVNLYTHTPIHPSRLTPPPLPAYTPVIIEWLTCVYSGCDVGCVNLYTHTPIHPSRLTPLPLPAYTPVIIEWLTCVYSGCDVGCVDLAEVDLELSAHPGFLWPGFTHLTQRREDSCNIVPLVKEWLT